MSRAIARPSAWANSSSASTVPDAAWAKTSTAFSVERMDCRRPAPIRGEVQAETASRWAVVFPLDDRPLRLMPQLSRPASDWTTPAKPASTPSRKCGQPFAETTATSAAFHPSRVPRAVAPKRALVASSSRLVASSPIAVPAGVTKTGWSRPSSRCHPGRETTRISSPGSAPSTSGSGCSPEPARPSSRCWVGS